MRLGSRAILLALILAPLAGCASPAPDEAESAEGVGATPADAAADRAALSSLLDDFLARTEDASAHDRFWAQDLVYSSSDGTRRGKAEIMAGFDAPEGTEPPAGSDAAEPGPTYSAEDVDIRLYGETAVVAFRLMIHPPEGSGESSSYNLNTGTFVKRNGEWRVVAWQSTRGAP